MVWWQQEPNYGGFKVRVERNRGNFSRILALHMRKEIGQDLTAHDQSKEILFCFVFLWSSNERNLNICKYWQKGSIRELGWNIWGRRWLADWCPWESRNRSTGGGIFSTQNGSQMSDGTTSSSCSLCPDSWPLISFRINQGLRTHSSSIF